MTLRKRKILISVTTAVLVLGVAVAVGVGLSGGGSDDDSTVAEPSTSENDEAGDGSQDLSDGQRSDTRGGEAEFLPEAMSGQEAVDALGDELETVAQQHGMTADELREDLLRDATLTVTPSGELLYEDTMTPPDQG